MNAQTLNMMIMEFVNHAMKIVQEVVLDQEQMNVLLVSTQKMEHFV